LARQTIQRGASRVYLAISRCSTARR
jgi:hypothetical protein